MASQHLHVVAHAVRDEVGRLEYVGAVSDVTGDKNRRRQDPPNEQGTPQIVDIYRSTRGVPDRMEERPLQMRYLSNTRAFHSKT